MYLLRTVWMMLAIIIMTASIFASGYQINEHGARAMGMGGAFVARASDGSAIYFNPAGLGFQKSGNVMFGSTLIVPFTSFTGPIPLPIETKMKDQFFTPINFYATYVIQDGLVAGLGVYNPYGLGTSWPEDWDGRLSAIKTDLQTFYVNPSIGYKVNEELYVGLGLSYVYGRVKLKQGFRALADNVGNTSNLDGTGSSFNFNLGVIYKLTKELQIGVSYRHLTEIDFSGDVTFNGLDSVTSLYFTGGTGEATLPMPYNLTAGIAYKISDALTVEADFQYVGWSAYDQLAIKVSQPKSLSTLLHNPPATPIVKNWKNSTVTRLGLEYAMDETSALRFGYIYDGTPQPTPVHEPMLPDANRNEFTIGYGTKIMGGLTIDVAYQVIFFEKRNSNSVSPNRAYFYESSSTAHLLGVNFSYSY